MDDGDATIRRVLVTGATGYVGGRLVPELLEAGYEVRCFARTPAKLDGRDWRDRVEVVQGDAADPDDVLRALDGMDAAYYLIHSMDGEGGFQDRDRHLAETFRDGAAAAGLQQILYLGGLGDDDAELSDHLDSRHEVGRVLADGPVPVTELRAAIVIGSGSASFEMLRHLVDVLPVMVTPRWVETPCQPIAVRDVLGYLVDCLSVPRTRGEILEIGGPEVMTYRQMMERYADVAGLRRRLIIGVPLLTPRLSSHWVNLVTPLPRGLAAPLVESLRHDVVVSPERDVARFLQRDCLTFTDSVDLALRRVKDLAVPTTWTGAASSGRAQAEPLPDDPEWSGGTLLEDERVIEVAAPPEAVFAVVRGIGGDRGYYTADALWSVRGLIDTLLGGVGRARGRRHPEQLSVGDAVDWWRVETIRPPELLRLSAEMRLPGRAWLEWHVEPLDDGGARLVQRARYHPRGVWGRLYWYALVPFHAIIFPRMARHIAEAAEEGRGAPGEHEVARDAA